MSQSNIFSYFFLFLAHVNDVSAKVAKQALEFFKPFATQLGSLWVKLVQKVHDHLQKITDVTPEPVSKITPEPVANVTPELVAKITPEPVAKITPEPVAKITHEPVAITEEIPQFNILVLAQDRKYSHPARIGDYT